MLLVGRRIAVHPSTGRHRHRVRRSAPTAGSIMTETDTRSAQRPSRLAPLAGVGAAALWFGGTQVFVGTRSGDLVTAEDILAHYVANGDVVVNAVWAIMLGSALFLVFLACLSGRIRREERIDGPLAPLTFAAGTVLAVAQFAALATDFDAGRDAAQYPIEASTAEAYFYLGDAWFIAGALMAGVLLAATGLAILRTRMFHRAVGWFSLIAAIPLVVPPTAWVGMFFLLPVWVTLLAVVMARSAPAPAALDTSELSQHASGTPAPSPRSPLSRSN
jgi:hypothetical protein